MKGSLEERSAGGERGGGGIARLEMGRTGCCSLREDEAALDGNGTGRREEGAAGTG